MNEIDLTKPFIIGTLVYKENLSDGHDIVATIKDGFLIKYNPNETITLVNLDMIERMVNVRQYV